MMRYVALLRGINVGTSIRVPMKDLKLLVEGLGCQNVLTYLNSGNVIFSSEEDPVLISVRLNEALSEKFGKAIPTLVKQASDICRIAEALPIEWANNQTQLSDVVYLFDELDAKELIREFPIKHEFIDIRPLPGAIIWNVKRELYNRSQIIKIISHPSYARMTARNVNTARKLAALLGGPDAEDLPAPTSPL